MRETELAVRVRSERDKDSKTETRRDRDRIETKRYRDLKRQKEKLCVFCTLLENLPPQWRAVNLCDCECVTMFNRSLQAALGVCRVQCWDSVGGRCWAGRFWVDPLYVYMPASKQVSRASTDDCLTTQIPVRQHSPVRPPLSIPTGCG